jgi:hypothetical protein
MSRLTDVIEKLDMDFRIVKLDGYEEYGVEVLQPKWFGMFGGLRWRRINRLTRHTREDMQRSES